MKRLSRILTTPLLAAAIGAVPAFSSSAVSSTPSSDAKISDYWKSTFGERGLAESAGGAAASQAILGSRSWGTGAAGFGRHIAGGLTGHVVKNSVQFGIGSLLHENRHYMRTEQTGFGARLKNALINNTLLARSTKSGKQHPAVGRLSGSIAGGFASNAWKPAAGLGGGFASGGILFGVSAATNVTREFWPEIRRTLPHRHHASKEV